MSDVHLSLIVPVYNAENHVEGNIRTILDYLGRQSFASELIAVDDGSRDGTLAILNRMKQTRPNLKVLSNGHNQGKGAAVRTGFQAASGRYLAFNDSDLAYPAEEVLKILKALEGGSDVAVACRVLPESRFEISPAFFRYLYTRHLMGRFFNLLVRLFILPGILDTQAGLKGFRREAVEKIFPKQTLNRFSFDVEILFLAKKFGFKIEQVPVNFRYFFEETTVRFFRDTVNMLKDLCRVRLNDAKGLYG